MKYLLIGDMHGADLKELENVFNAKKANVLVCTGDFDQIKTIHQFIDLEKKIKEKGKKVICIGGNHDHAILTNLYIHSGTLMKQGKTSYELHKELVKDSIAKNYIEDLLKNQTFTTFLDQKKHGKKYPTIVVHGALDGDLSSYSGCPDDIKQIWARLLTYGDYEKNFESMKKQGQKIMIRGHDHKPALAHKGEKNDSTELTHVELPAIGIEYKLFTNRIYVINPGAFFDGCYALINTNEKEPIVQYCKL